MGITISTVEDRRVPWRNTLRVSAKRQDHFLFTVEQYTTINQSTAGCFDLRVFVNCLQASTTCKQLTKTLGSKRPAVDWLIVVYCSSVNFASINATMSLYSITISYIDWLILWISPLSPSHLVNFLICIHCSHLPTRVQIALSLATTAVSLQSITWELWMLLQTCCSLP